MNGIHQRIIAAAKVTVFVALLAANTGLTQTADPDRLAELETRIAEARQRLDLGDEQVEQIRPVFAAGAQSMAAALERHGIDLSLPPEQRERPGFRKLRAIGKDLRTVREETTEAIAAILNESQMAEYREMQEERSAEMRDRIRGRR